MTGTASNRGKVFMDFDGYKNQEWLRRRKLRLEQVRKQSSEIAKALRQKVNEEEKRRIEEYERLKDEKFRIWKAQKLEELEAKLKGALEGFGAGYKLAEEEPDSELIMEEKMKINSSKAQERGEIALQEELRRKRLAEERLTSVTERKKMTRKREDLRSALVRSLPVKNQFTDVEEACVDGGGQTGEQRARSVKEKMKRINEKHSAPAVQEKVPVKSTRKRKLKQKLSTCKCKETGSDSCPLEEAETVWINLDDVQSSSVGDVGGCRRNSKVTLRSKKNGKERSEGSVEFYDFSSRYYCKSFREYPHLVERISHESEELNAHELAKAEEELEKERSKKKVEADAVTQGRGVEALRKEKVSRDYGKMMAKLEELSKKEKILKAQQRDLPSFLHMNDARLSEREKTKQRIMESKFESVYYETTSRIPQTGLPHSEPVFSPSGGGDYFLKDDRLASKLCFSTFSLKHNTPVSSSLEAVPQEATRRPEEANSQRALLRNIKKTLKEGRELRRRECREWEGEGWGGEGSIGGEEAVGGREGASRRCQESQTENWEGVGGGGELRLKSFDRGGDESLPVSASTSTSYRSPPTAIRCHRLQEFLDYLEGLSEGDEHRALKTDSKIEKKVNGILRDLLPVGGSGTSEEEGEGEGEGEEEEEGEGEGEEREEERKMKGDRSLSFYIKRLLNMSRECIADLSVSSENISTPNITDLDGKKESEASHSECPAKEASKSEELIRKSRLERADALEKSIRNWKMILEKKSGKRLTEPDNVPDCLERVGDEDKRTKKPFTLTSSPRPKSKYDEITKKCSERILELSDMLDRVRKDKEKLLTSASGGSSLNLSRNDRDSEKGLDVEEEEVVPVRRKAAQMPKSPVVESFINRYNFSRAKEETVSTVAVADSQSFQDLDESLDSWPDVMDELLKREIITSPFKWSDGDISSDFTSDNDYTTKPSSIESVIGNFRREIDKIKPFSLTGPCSETDSPSKPRWVAEGGYLNSLQDSKRGASRGDPEVGSGHAFPEESSVDSINRCLTSLGLNWAKSFLRKNAESRAMSSSSNSGRKSSGDEEEAKA